MTDEMKRKRTRREQFLAGMAAASDADRATLYQGGSEGRESAMPLETILRVYFLKKLVFAWRSEG